MFLRVGSSWPCGNDNSQFRLKILRSGKGTLREEAGKGGGSSCPPNDLPSLALDAAGQGMVYCRADVGYEIESERKVVP